MTGVRLVHLGAMLQDCCKIVATDYDGGPPGQEGGQQRIQHRGGDTLAVVLVRVLYFFVLRVRALIKVCM